MRSMVYKSISVVLVIAVGMMIMVAYLMWQLISVLFILKVVGSMLTVVHGLCKMLTTSEHVTGLSG